ncbi:RNA polymerase sigma factor, partial [Vineibacter terrae]|uniref:RNA polymerase sigma factor n=1 Tax=Vineibacter terrae TaxID=2586908 RepID=UPI002E32D33A
MASGRQALHDMAALRDDALYALALRRDAGAIRVLTQRYNQRLYRVAWGILRNEADAEEAVQDAYVKAFTASASFEGHASYATWLTRIVINEALERRRSAERRARLLERQGITEMAEYRARLADAPISHGSPEETAARAEVAQRLQAAVARLPEMYRTVFVLRDVEGMSIEDTSRVLGIPEQAVKTRLFRARRRLQQILEPDLRAALQEAFPFGGERCAALTE